MPFIGISVVFDCLKSSVADPNPSYGIRMFLGLPDPLVIDIDLYPDPSIIKHNAKIVRKTLIPTRLCLLLDFLSLKNFVNVFSGF